MPNGRLIIYILMVTYVRVVSTVVFARCGVQLDVARSSTVIRTPIGNLRSSIPATPELVRELGNALSLTPSSVSTWVDLSLVWEHEPVTTTPSYSVPIDTSIEEAMNLTLFLSDALDKTEVGEVYVDRVARSFERYQWCGGIPTALRIRFVTPNSVLRMVGPVVRMVGLRMSETDPTYSDHHVLMDRLEFNASCGKLWNRTTPWDRFRPDIEAAHLLVLTGRSECVSATVPALPYVLISDRGVCSGHAPDAPDAPASKTGAAGWFESRYFIATASVVGGLVVLGVSWSAYAKWRTRSPAAEDIRAKE